MPTRIRLRRMGRKKAPHYRIVVADSASPRDGRFVETLGYYKPLSQPARLVLDMERVDHWIGQGAETSSTMKSLIRKARRGGDAKVALGEPDTEVQKAKRAERLAARRAAEKKADAETKAAEKAAAAEVAAAAAAEAATAEASEAEAAEAPAAEAEEPAAEAEAPAAEAQEAPAAETGDAPAAEAAADAGEEEETSE